MNLTSREKTERARLDEITRTCYAAMHSRHGDNGTKSDTIICDPELRREYLALVRQYIDEQSFSERDALLRLLRLRQVGKLK